MPIYPVRRLAHVPFTMDDGIVLSAAVLLPDADGRWPAVVDAVPYRKDDDFYALDWDTYAWLAARGFACVRLDLRGSGSSTGILEGEYLAREQEDVVEVIRQLAERPWCTGRVGLTGVSWGGFAAVQVAARRPPGLDAIVPIHFTTDRYRCDVHYLGGALQVDEAVGWPGEMVAEMAMPPLPALVGSERFEALWRDRLERTPQWTLEWLRHQRRDAFWRHGSICEDWAAIACPVLAIGGWLDGYVGACLDVLEHVRAPRRAVIGPWGHARPHRGWPEPAIDHRELVRRWFERFLCDVPNGVDEEPALVVHVADGMPRTPYPDVVPGRFRGFTRLGTAPPLVLHLAGDALAAAPPAAASPRTWRGPLAVGIGRPWWCGSRLHGHSTDMRPDDAGSLVYDGAALAAPVEILGRPLLRARVSADRPVALLAARLEEVHPDGWSSLVARGVLNLTHRDSDEEPTALVAGVSYDVEVPLAPVGVAIGAGQRLRLALAGSDFPLAWPAPAAFTLTVHGGTLELSLLDRRAEVPAPPLPAVTDGPPNSASDDEGAEPSWTVERDHVARVTRNRWRQGSTARLPGGGSTTASAHVCCEVGDDDPTSCRAISENEQRVVHPGVVASAVSRLEISCDAGAFHVAIDLRVERDGEPFHEAAWRESFPRDLC